MSTLEHFLANARDSLIDKTLKNRLLNFKPTKLGTFGIPGVPPGGLYKWLVTEENPIRPVPGEPSASYIHEPAPHPDDHLGELKTPHVLKVPIAWKGPELQKRLAYIRKQTILTVEEQGYNPLYLYPFRGV